jgi:hypothetical protein
MDPTAFAELVRAVTADDPPVTVTLVLPFDGSSPDRGPDGIRARRLARTAVAALTAGGDGLPAVDRDAMAALADRLDEVADEVGTRLDRGIRGEGLACVVTPSTARIVGLTRTPRERVVIEATPTLIDPLLDAVTADAEVDVLLLSTGGGATPGTRLLRLSDHHLEEPAGTGFPLAHDVRDHGEPRKEEPPDDRVRDAYVDDFLRRVDAALMARASPTTASSPTSTGTTTAAPTPGSRRPSGARSTRRGAARRSPPSRRSRSCPPNGGPVGRTSTCWRRRAGSTACSSRSTRPTRRASTAPS